MLYSWMVSHPIPVKIINLSLIVLNILTEKVPIFTLLTAAVGISAEGGEFMEIVKKMVFKVNLGQMIIESILLLSWVMLCGM